MCIEMVQMVPPYYAENIPPMRVLFLIPSNPSPTLKEQEKYSPEYNDFIAKCLEKEPQQRWSAEDLLHVVF
jgi:serine/threonine protein kinase